METAINFLIDEINEQTKRILNFQAFRNSPILSRFLEFIVAETIHERELHIKEYNIALNVLNRNSDFNPHEDAIVRIHAGRLRRALNDYYLTEGIYDTIIIHIPKGSYIPKFIDAGTLKSNNEILAVSQEQNVKPIVAVFPFRTTPQSPDMDEFSLMLGEQFSAELSRFPEISVIGYYSMETMAKIKENILEAGKSIHADYIITGSLQYNSQTIRMRVTLLITTTGEVLMTKSFEKDIINAKIFEMQDVIAQSVLAEVGAFHVLIFGEMTKTATALDSSNSGKCQIHG